MCHSKLRYVLAVHLLLALFAALNVPSLRELRAKMTEREEGGKRASKREKGARREEEPVELAFNRPKLSADTIASALGLLSQLLSSGKGAVNLKPAVC